MPEYKSFEFKAADVDTDKRIIKGYAATWDEDTIGDTIDPNAFNGTIERRGPKKTKMGNRSKVKVGFNHGEIVGIPLVMVPDKKGLYTESLIDETPTGNVVLTRVKSGSLDQMSFTYDVLDSEGEKGKRLLKELEIYEYGPVDFACNELAEISGLKFRSMLDLDGLKALHDLKAGRVISAATMQKLAQALLTGDVTAAGTNDEEEAEKMAADTQEEKAALSALLEEARNAQRGFAKNKKTFAMGSTKGDEPMEDDDEEEEEGKMDEEDPEDPEDEGYEKSISATARKALTPGQEAKRHPVRADICVRLHGVAQTVYGDRWDMPDDPPTDECIDGAILILQQVIEQLESLKSDE